MKASSNAILALSRSFYGKRLTNADFDALLHCGSVGEAAQYLLLKTPYADAIAESGVTSFTARFLEELVSKHRFASFVSLCRFEMAIGNAFYRYFIMRDEVDQIERATLMLISGNTEIYLQRVNSFLDKHLSIDLFAIGRANSLEEIAASLDRTAYGSIYRDCLLAPKVDYLTFEQALEAHFEKEVRKLCKTCFSAGEREALLELICRAQDCRLIERVWRAKRFYRGVPDLYADLTARDVPLTLLNERTLKQLASCESATDVIRILEKSPYHGWISEKGEQSVEYQLEKQLYEICRKQIRFSTYPGVVMFCYLQLSAVEAKNLLRVIEGVKFHVPPQVIAQNLILEPTN